MGLFSFAFAGASLILIGAWESLSSSPPPPMLAENPITSSPPPHRTPRFSTVTLISTAFLSLLFIFDAFLSFTDALGSKDKVGSALQLQVIAVSALFFLFSFLGLLSNLSKSCPFPFLLLDLTLFFGFIEEFLLYYFHLKDPKGVENRYYSLMLVPISICIISTMIELKKPNSNMPRLARGLGLILQGTWFIQMGLSFFTGFIAHNCILHHKSRGNYTIKCNGHMDSHRGGAIAVLLFNCYLALLVALISGVYSVVGRMYMDVGDRRSYRPLGREVQGVEGRGKFTLDSDSEDGGIDEIKQEEGCVDVSRRVNGAIELAVNGHVGVHR
uniref:Uncharacterized protein n=1 Tax=Opuntia streptacantha TaxID=393608 RepID=A0A7C8ZJB6_OPUST